MRSHFLQLFNCIQITLDPQINDIMSFRIFLERLEALKLPRVQYFIEMIKLDDTCGDGMAYLKALIK